MLRPLCLLLAVGCATGRSPAPPSGEDLDRSDAEAAAPSGGCERAATVKVHVDNRSTADIAIAFGSFTPARAAPGLSRTTYDVPRSYLRTPIRVRIARGGLQVHTPTPVATEPVVCNDATLVIGPRPSYSFFYGELLEPPSRAPAAACCTAIIRALVPASSDTVYLTGSLPELGPWRPDGLAMAGTGRQRVAEVSAPEGTTFEYKFTLGSWDREAVDSSGAVPRNHQLLIDGDVEARHEITAFKKDPREYIADWEGSGVEGRLVYWTDVRSAHLEPTRHVEIWLPPAVDESDSTRYPVLYMHDGQNLFDPRIANTGVDWGVDEAVVRLIQRGVMTPVIVVGVWNTAARLREYSPWHDASAYARFLIEELMPRVNAAFPTLSGPEHTTVMGSSMGGLLSLYLVLQHPDVFGACGCLSTHVPLSEAGLAAWLPDLVTTGTPDTVPYLVREIQSGISVPPGVRYWFDYGTLGLDAQYGPVHDAVRSWLRQQGLVEGDDFVVRRYEGADHNEASWRARLDDPLTFLFGPRAAR